jgi:hypothetical protein
MSTQIRGNTQIMAGTILDAQIAALAAIATSKLADGGSFFWKDGSVTATADFNLGGFKITNLADPTTSTDAATKNYVDNMAGSGLEVKTPALFATTGNITLSGLATQTGGDWASALTAGDRIAVIAQTTASQNGIYVAGTGSWTRATDFNSTGNIIHNSFFFIEQGTTLADTGWVLTTDGAITVDTTALTFTQFSSAGTILAGTGLSKSGNTLSADIGDGLTTVSNALTVLAADATITVDGTGVKLAALTAAYILVGNSSNVATGVALSGDATLTNAGVLTLAAGVAKYASFIFGETPSGSVNGTNAAFTLANTPQSGTVRVYLNGMRQNAGVGNDYTISSGTVTFLTAPSTGDVILVDYSK